MIECDALRLIDEYIKSSGSFTRTTTSTRSNSPNPNQFRLSQLSSSSCKNTPNNEDLYFFKKNSHCPCTSDDSGVKSNETNVFSPATSSSLSTTNIELKPTRLDCHQTNLSSDSNNGGNMNTSTVLDKELTLKNPNRPYSYYAATNFNPLDFAELFKDSEKPISSENKTLFQNNNNNNNRSITTNKKKSLFKTNSNNLLSLSLSDFKASNLSPTKNKQVQVGLRTNPLPRKNKNYIKANSYCDRDGDSKVEMKNDEHFLNGLQDDLNTNIKGQNRRSMALRFNKFIRNIFRSTSKNKIRETKKNVALEIDEKNNSNVASKGKMQCNDDVNDNDDVFENNQFETQTNKNANNRSSNRYSNLTENLRFSKLFGSFRKIGKFYHARFTYR